MRLELRLRAVVGTAAVMAAFWSGCGDDGGEGGGADAGPSDAAVGDGGVGDTATVRLAHTLTGAGPVDVYVDGASSPAATNLAYLAVSGPLEVATDATIALYPTGTSPGSGTAAATFNRTGMRSFVNGERYTIYLRSTPSGVAASALRDGNITAPAAGRVGLTLVNAVAPPTFLTYDTDGDRQADTPSVQPGATFDTTSALDVEAWSLLDGSLPPRRIATFLLPDDLLADMARAFVFTVGDPAALSGDEGLALLYVSPMTGTARVLRADDPRARVRVLHASANAPAVDVYPRGATGGTPLAAGLAFGESTGYVDVPIDAGFDVYAAGATPGVARPVITVNRTAAEILTRDEDHTLVALGDAAPEASPLESLRAELFVDTFAAPPAGRVAVRLVNGSPASLGLTFDLDGVGDPETGDVALFRSRDATLQETGGTVTAFTATAGAPVRLSSFEVEGGLGPAGGLSYVVATGDRDAHPADDQALSLLVSPALGDAPGALPVVEALQNPSVWFLHAVPDSDDPLTLRILDETRATEIAQVPGLQFGTFRGQQLPVGTYGFEMRAETTVISEDDGTFTFPVATRWLVVVTGLAEPDATDDPAPVGFLLLEDRFDRTDAARARARGVHAAPDASAVEVGTVTQVGGVDVFAPVSGFGTLSYRSDATAMGVALDAGTVDLGVQDSVTPATIPTAVFEDVELPAGTRAFLVAAGEFAPEALDQDPVELFVIDTRNRQWSTDRYDFRFPMLP